jgi:hypothetical protein
MTNPKGSEPARPVPGHFLAKGEDVRADFAKHIMAGICTQGIPFNAWENTAKDAVRGADALIAALSNPRSE